jgi:hypothetical protein
MRRDDYMLMIASNLLTLETDKLPAAIEHFSGKCELRQLRKAGAVSIGGQHPDDREVGLVRWIEALRAERIKRVACSWSAHAQPPVLEPHLAAAFRGARQSLLQVVTEHQVRSFALLTLSSSQYEMTPEQFIEVIDAQELRDVLWTRLADVVCESNRMNGRPDVDSTTIRGYLAGEGNAVFEFFCSNLVEEAQVEGMLHRVPFVMPDRYRKLFKRRGVSAAGEPERIFLYPTAELDADDVLALVDAQPCSRDIWVALVAKAAESQSNIPDISAADWAGSLHALDEVQFAAVAQLLCEVICNVCRERGLPRTLPAALSGKFGPDEQEHARILVRHRLDMNGYFPCVTEHPWELYYFSPISEHPAPAPPTRAVEQVFGERLSEIERFAVKTKSPFTEHFRLAAWFLGDDVPAGRFDGEHCRTIASRLAEGGFSESAVERLDNLLIPAPDMLALGFNFTRIRHLLAADAADVFGGMGSWNDQYFENGQEDFERVSAAMYRAQRELVAAMLTPEACCP